MAETRWTPLMVEERLVEAADVMPRLPEVRVLGHFNTWPKILHEFADLVGQAPPRLKCPPPSSDAIGRMAVEDSGTKYLLPSCLNIE